MMGASAQGSGPHRAVGAGRPPGDAEARAAAAATAARQGEAGDDQPEERLFEPDSPDEDPYDLSEVAPRVPHGRAAFSAAMILAVLWCAWTFRSDFAYLFGGFMPRDLGEIQNLFKGGADPALPHNTYVRFSGLPHYPAFTYSLDGSDPGRNPEGTHFRLERFVGTDGRFHVIFRERNDVPFNELVSGPFEGRLVRADEFPELNAVRDEYVHRYGVTWKPGSYIVLDGDTPQSRWYYWVLGAFIVVVLALNGWQLAKWWRGWAQARGVRRRADAAMRRAGTGAGGGAGGGGVDDAPSA